MNRGARMRRKTAHVFSHPDFNRRLRNQTGIALRLAGLSALREMCIRDRANASTIGWQEHLADDANTRVEAAVIAVVPLVFIIGLIFPQLAAPVILLMAGRMYGETKSAGMLILLLLGMALLLLYKPVLEALWNGRTVGKRLMSIQVTAQDGGRASAGKIFLRELVGDTLLGGITGGITSVVSIFTVAIGREDVYKRQG